MEYSRVKHAKDEVERCKAVKVATGSALRTALTTGLDHTELARLDFEASQALVAAENELVLALDASLPRLYQAPRRQA